jgi:hypothetical protein
MQHGSAFARPARNALQTIDEMPYRAAIAAGVKLVMVSWATYPARAVLCARRL